MEHPLQKRLATQGALDQVGGVGVGRDAMAFVAVGGPRSGQAPLRIVAS
jgi:hypothetical protein